MPNIILDNNIEPVTGLDSRVDDIDNKVKSLESKAENDHLFIDNSLIPHLQDIDDKIKCLNAIIENDHLVRDGSLIPHLQSLQQDFQDFITEEKTYDRKVLFGLRVAAIIHYIAFIALLIFVIIK